VSRTLPGIAVLALLCCAPVTHGQAPTGPGAWASTWLADSLRWGSIEMPPAWGDCPATPHGPHRLPPRPAGSWLGLVFADGRQARWDSLSAAGGALYWPLERACQTLGIEVAWDPDLLRGELLIADTLRCAFIVGAEFLHCGARAMQMRVPVLYLGDRVLLPLDCIDLLTRQVIADRFRFRADSLLLVQQPAPGPVAAMSSEQVGNRCYFAWKLPDSRAATFATDGIATITVDVPGLRLDPSHPPRPEPRAGGCLWAVRPSPGGVTYVLRVDPSVRAWRIQSREQSGDLRLSLSSNAADRNREGYRPWEPPRAAGRERDVGPVVLVLPDPREGDLAEAPGPVRSLLRAVADLVRERLEDGGAEVVVTETAGRPGGWRGVGTRRPAACVCLLPDLAGFALLPGCRLVTAEPLPGERPTFPLDDRSAEPPESNSAPGGRAGTPVLRRWESVAAAHAGGTHRLAWLMQLYLETEFPHGRFARNHWSGAFLEGIDAPAMAIYFGETGSWTQEAPPGGQPDSTEAAIPVPERLAAAIAGAILMFLMGVQSG
jgi:hypothetical protein